MKLGHGVPGRRGLIGMLPAVLLLGLSPPATAPAQTAPVAAAATPAAAAPLPRPGRVRTLVQVRGDIWRANNGNWWTLVYVTPEGILLVDTINEDYAKWLKAELAQRFPGKRVRYVVYSHTHWDHSGGADVFADARPHYVAQARALTNMDGRWPHMPGDMTDRNNNGTLEAEEIVIPTLAHAGICGGGRGTFESYDTGHTGNVTPAQWWAMHHMVKPDLVYSERMKIVLGGRTIELVFPGLNHADDGTVVYFPAEKVAFSADFPADALVTTSMRSFPSACGVFDQHPLAEWIRSYRTLEALDFDILVQGHGTGTFTKADVTEGREYFEYLRSEVSEGMAAGKTLDQLKRELTLPKYKDWAYYDMLREDNIEAAYLNLKAYR